MAATVQPVSGSSFIAGIGYDPDTEELVVRFRDGKTYRHEGVPEGVYQAFVQSGSMGQYWHAMIKNHYNAKRR
jgi:KTSC domain